MSLRLTALRLQHVKQSTCRRLVTVRAMSDKPHKTPEEMHETRVQAGKKAAAARDPEEIKETIGKAVAASAARSTEEHSEAGKKAAANRDPEEIKDTIQKASAASAARPEEDRKASARKAAQTRAERYGEQTHFDKEQ